MTVKEAITAIKTWEGCMRKTYKDNEFTMEFIEAAAVLCRNTEMCIAYKDENSIRKLEENEE